MYSSYSTHAPIQQHLDFEAPPAHRDVDTCQAAAASIADKAPARRAIILDLIVGQGTRGYTIDELTIATKWGVQSVCPRVNELHRAGLIVDSGLRRDTRRRRKAKVWIAMEE